MGKIIVLEGLDGCGKSTQFDLIKKENPHFVCVSFPNYADDSGKIVSRYLSGEFKEENPLVSAFSASSFYSIDRYISYKNAWEKDYRAGKTILAARYTTSNAIYQMAKLDKAHWEEYRAWLYDYEYVKLGIPRPDKVIYLDVPLEISQRLLSERYAAQGGQKDVHEANLDFMKRCSEAAHYVAEKDNPKWEVINCTKDGEMRSIEDIHRDIASQI